jgi:hypothetical protein
VFGLESLHLAQIERLIDDAIVTYPQPHPRSRALQRLDIQILRGRVFGKAAQHGVHKAFANLRGHVQVGRHNRARGPNLTAQPVGGVATPAADLEDAPPLAHPQRREYPFSARLEERSHVLKPLPLSLKCGVETYPCVPHVVPSCLIPPINKKRA